MMETAVPPRVERLAAPGRTWQASKLAQAAIPPPVRDEMYDRHPHPRPVKGGTGWPSMRDVYAAAERLGWDVEPLEVGRDLCPACADAVTA